MAGKTTWDQAVVDQYVDLFEELHRETYKEYYAVSEEEKVCLAPQGFVGLMVNRYTFLGSDSEFFLIYCSSKRSFFCCLE